MAHDIGVTFLKPPFTSPFTASLQNIPHPGHPRSCSGGEQDVGSTVITPPNSLQEPGRAARAAGKRGGQNQDKGSGRAHCPSSRPTVWGKGGQEEHVCAEGGRRITPGEGSVWWAGERGRSILCCLLSYTIETHSCKNVFTYDLWN